jgi:hypothetical protein
MPRCVFRLQGQRPVNADDLKFLKVRDELVFAGRRMSAVGLSNASDPLRALPKPAVHDGVPSGSGGERVFTGVLQIGGLVRGDQIHHAVPKPRRRIEGF